jgi:hypothetical protein
MAQGAWPSADIGAGSISGSWFPSGPPSSERWACLNESGSTDVTNYIYHTALSLEPCWQRLSSVANPGTHSGMHLRARVKLNNPSPPVNIVAQLVQGIGASGIAVLSGSVIDTDYANFSWSLSNNEASKINNYGDLYIVLNKTSTFAPMIVTYVYLELPDAPSGSANTPGYFNGGYFNGAWFDTVYFNGSQNPSGTGGGGLPPIGRTTRIIIIS